MGMLFFDFRRILSSLLNISGCHEHFFLLLKRGIFSAFLKSMKLVNVEQIFDVSKEDEFARKIYK